MSENLPKIINLLNTNILQNQPQFNEQQRQQNNPFNISTHKLQSLIGQNFGNIIGLKDKSHKIQNGIELVGQGINGMIYKINHPRNEYICKCISYTKENMDQLEYEINLIKTLQQNEIAVRYINPCLGIAITAGLIITIFPRFHASTLNQIITTIHRPEFNSPQRVSLIKYLIYQMILGLSEMHRQGVCHRQIDTGSVLIEIKPDQGLDSINHKTNDIWYAEDQIPLRVKYTNFGFGCLNTCLPMISNKDPYQPNGPVDYTGSTKYDIWCLGLLFLKLLYIPKTTRLVSPELEKFLDVVNNHMLVSLDKRKSSDYVKDTLAINDKLYDDIGSDGNNETPQLIKDVFNQIIK